MEFVPIDKIKIGKYRVRTTFDEEKMRSLVTSIKRKKVLSPIWVKTPDEEGYYELIAGERRLRAAKEAGLKEVPVEIRHVGVDEAILEMGIENIQREDLSFYERGRWVAKMKKLGFPIPTISEETGIPQRSLYNWLEYYEESERVQKIATVAEEFKRDRLPLRSMLEAKAAPIPIERRTELEIEATKMERPPRVGEIKRAARLIAQEPELPAREALERARGVTYLVPVPPDLMPRLQAQAKEWALGIQETIVRILRDYLE